MFSAERTTQHATQPSRLPHSPGEAVQGMLGASPQPSQWSGLPGLLCDPTQTPAPPGAFRLEGDPWAGQGQTLGHRQRDQVGFSDIRS